MRSTGLSSTILSLLLCLIAVDFTTAVDNAIANATELSQSDEHNKLLLECQHPDYRTYIKCLKRHKRHHSHTDHDSDGGEFRHKCFDECGMDQCDTTKCVHDCHKRCMKKTKETRQIITQYETTCESGECKDEGKSSDIPTTNITTNIDVNNVINNHMPKTDGHDNPCAGNTPCCGGTPCGGGGVGGGGVGGGAGGGGGGWYGSSTGLTLIPQIQFVPQLTFGLGAGGFAGGGLWQHGQAGGVDCSACANPFLRYRCDVSCYTTQVNQNTGKIPIGNTGCQSPQCVGGNQ